MARIKKIFFLVLAFFFLFLTNSYSDDFGVVQLYSDNFDYDAKYFSNPDFKGMRVAAGTLPFYTPPSEVDNVYVIFGTDQFLLDYYPKWSVAFSMNIYAIGLEIGLDDSKWKTDAFFYIDKNKNNIFDSGEPSRIINARQDGTYFFMNPPKITSITGGVHPIITWDPVLNADQYRFGIAGINPDGTANTADIRFISDWFTDTSFTYTGTLFESYQPYTIFIEARDNITGTTTMVNRSRFITQYSVPEPATAILLIIGLLGTAGLGRKKLFNK